jgi:hypothetical protein
MQINSQRSREAIMKALNKKNLLAMTLLTVSGVILASSYSDLMIQSDSFMSEVQVEEIKRLDDVAQRYVASESSVKLPNIINCPVDKDSFSRMKQDIEGKWTLNKYKYLANNQMDEEQIYRTVKLDLLENCDVMVNEDTEQVFSISLLTEAKTMAIFKLFNEGYEVLELKKIKEQSEKSLVTKEKVSVAQKEEVAKEKKDEQFEANLVLESANTPDGYLKSNLVRGTFEVFEGYLNIDATVNFDTNKERVISIQDAEVNGGTFVVGDEQNPTVGIITANGNKSSYTVRFSTGEYKGIILNFTTEEKLDEILSQVEESEEQLALKAEINERPTEQTMTKVAKGRGFAF